jgi:hypothetical protein
MKRLALAIACAASLSGCAVLTAEPWPKAGAGGFAELLPVDDQRVATLRERLEALRERGAETATAGDFGTAQLLLTRVEREIGGELLVDAEVDANTLDRLVVKMNGALSSGPRAPSRNTRS